MKVIFLELSKREREREREGKKDLLRKDSPTEISPDAKKNVYLIYWQNIFYLDTNFLIFFYLILHKIFFLQ